MNVDHFLNACKAMTVAKSFGMTTHEYLDVLDVSTQAAACGFQHEFDSAFWFLFEHSKSQPGLAPKPRDVLQTLLENHRYDTI